MSVYSIDQRLLIAHRGGANEHHENSPAAFEAARNAGLRYIETDAHATADDVAVLCHDATLDRTTTASGAIRDFTWRELKRVRLESGEPAIMRVDEALASFPDVVMNIDAKSDHVVGPLVEAIRGTGAEGRVCVASFSERRLRRMRRALPRVTSSVGVAGIVALVAASRAAVLTPFVPRASVVQVPVTWRGARVVTPEVIDRCHSLGMPIHVWTINDIDEARSLVALGVDGIITDIPLAMRSAGVFA